MFENIAKFFKNMGKKQEKNKAQESSKDTAKERLHLVLMQDRANVSADFLELMKQEIIEVIKKYIDIDEKEIDVRLTNQENSDGTNGAPALYANIPILNIKNDARKMNKNEKVEENKEEQKEELIAEEQVEEKQDENAEIEKEIEEKADDDNIEDKEEIAEEEKMEEVQNENDEQEEQQVEKVVEEVKSVE